MGQAVVGCKLMNTRNGVRGSTAWLTSRIELMTEDCRSEMTSAKIIDEHTEWSQGVHSLING